MRIATKRNGKILMLLGVLLIVIGFFGIIMTPRSVYEQAEQTSIYPWYTIILSFMVLLGPFIAVVGIPVFIIGAKRVPSKLMNILKSSPHIRTRIKISFLAQQLGINEKDVVSTVSRLRSNGEPILIDNSTLEVIYNPTLSPPTAHPSQLEMEAKPLEKPVQKEAPIFMRTGRFLSGIIIGTLTQFVMTELLAGIMMSIFAYFLGHKAIYALLVLFLHFLGPGIVAGIVAGGTRKGAVAGCLAGLIYATLRQISLEFTIFAVIMLTIGGWIGGAIITESPPPPHVPPNQHHHSLSAYMQ